MMKLKTFLAFLAVVLCGAMVAQAATVGLYNDDGYEYFGPGTKTRSQHFSASESLNALTDNFDSVTIMIDNGGETVPMTGTMSLYPWLGTWSASQAGTAIGSVAVNVPAGQVGALVTLTGFGELDYTQQYMMDLVGGISTGTNWGLRSMHSFNGGPNQHAFNGTDTWKTDRQYQVWLNQVPEPSSLALLLVGGLGFFLRRRR